MQLTYLYADAAYPWQLGFQNGASPAFDGIDLLHDTICFWVAGLAGLVFWNLGAAIVRFRGQIAHRYFTHGTALEVIWTILPAVVLVAIAFPSFKLLYLMDEVLSPTLTIKVSGSQWFWSYEYSDFINAEGESVEFDSYMVPEPELGQLRLLDVDNRVLIPADTHVRFIVTAKDVLHDWAVPALGVKMDAVPGRLNQVSVLAQREGVFYGQCSELCGVYHGFMPIAVEAVSLDRYVSWLEEQL
jgi:cytochrome c oxidase subunit 2